MKSNFYEYFKCNNKEELYLKLKEEKQETKELADYIEYAKEDISLETSKLKDLKTVFRYLGDNAPDENEVQIIMTNTRLNVMSDNKINIDTPFKDIMKESFVENARAAFIIHHEMNDKKAKEIEANLSILGYKITDRMRIDRNLVVNSQKTGISIGKLQEKDILNGKNKNMKFERKIEHIASKEFNEFMEYYAKKELKGLNIINDENRIKEILKVSAQEYQQENFGIIQYDKDYNITNVESIFKGGIGETNIDPKIILPTLLNNEIQGIAIFHNHPSDNSTPSIKDIEGTEKIQEIVKSFDKQLLDHYIISKERVFSFKEESLVIDNEYSKTLKEVEELKVSEKNTDTQTTKNKFKEEREKFVDDVIKSLEAGKIPWEKDWNNISGAIQNPVTGTKYKGINNVRLYTAMIKKGYTDNRWVTFKQAQNEGWKIRKGEKGTSIEIFKYYDKLTKKDLDREMLKTLSLEKQREYWAKNVYPMGKTYVVFNAEQIEGIPPLEYKKIEVDYNKLDKIIENSGVTFKYGGNAAYYNKAKDMIVLPRKEQFKSEAVFYGTALHELAHSTGHEARLNRIMEGGFGSKKYAREELIAEFASVFIGQEKGVGYTERNLENSKAYIQEWVSVLKNDKNELFTAIKEAEKASEMVMGYELGKELNIEKSKNKGIER